MEYRVMVDGVEYAISRRKDGKFVWPDKLPRSPRPLTVAENVLTHGTGALNIDGCRVGGESRPVMVRTGTVVAASSMSGESTVATASGEQTTLGRWPANLVLSHSEDCGDKCVDGCPVKEIDGQEDGVSRFYYVAKPSRSERNAGLDGFEVKSIGRSNGAQTAESAGEEYGDQTDIGLNKIVRAANSHPTVKPIALMRYLCRLVTPPGGTVLDPFLGSGTTGIAAVLEGFDFIGIEREEEYIKIARARIEWWQKNPPSEAPIAKAKETTAEEFF